MARACTVFVYGLSLLCSLVVAQAPLSFPDGTDKVRGVNLGGWLVLEPWITPSIFDNTGDPRIVDEYTFGQYQDQTVALGTLQNHWNTWITELDFIAIAKAGLTHVRLPIGYWAWDVSGGEPFIQGQLEYLEKAVTWAGNQGLKVIIDLHGAPGSQNGFDNSGQRMKPPKWHTAQSNIDRTNAIIQTLATEYEGSTVVTAIAALNEPAGFDGADILTVTKQYWQTSYTNIQPQQSGNSVLVIHDAFQPLSYWDNFMPSPDYQRVVMDTHIYQMFSVADNQMSYAQHISQACGVNDLATFHLPVVVGEWTAAATDCAKYLNGRGVGSRYDGTYPGSTRVGSCTGLTGSALTFSDDYKTFLGQYWQAQAMTYEKGAGWIQWTWKAENADEWTYQAGLANGWIPQNPTNYLYANVCG